MDVEGDAVVGDGVFVGGEDGEVGYRFGGALREFPESLAAGSGFLGEEEGAIRLLGEEDVLGDLDRGAAFLLSGQVGGLCAMAKLPDRAGGALGLAEGAGGLAELHEGGVELARMGGIDKGGGVVPKLALAVGGVDGGGVVKEAGEDPGDVGIDDGDGLAKGEGGDCPSGIASDAREVSELLETGWEAAFMVVEDCLGGFLEVADPVIVSETFPSLEELRLGRCGEGGEVGKAGEKLLESPVLAHGSDGGLLQHDLRDENGVGIGGLAPRVVFAVGFEPAQEGTAEGAGVAQGVLGGGWFQDARKIEH